MMIKINYKYFLNHQKGRNRSADNIQPNTGLIGLRPASEKRRYKVMQSLIGWVQY